VQSLDPEPGAAADLEEAFPRRLRAVVRAALKVLPSAEFPPLSSFRVLLSDEVVTIPYRIYAAEPSADSEKALPPMQRAVLDCLYTRHHDGWVRQRRLERVVGLVEPWVAPFVVQLIGEYVEEILLVIEQSLVPGLAAPGSLVDSVYGGFASENLRFMALTGQRATSYWDCYYRRRHPELSDYPGYRLVAALEAAAARRGTAAGIQP
jgi:hypothetical protein